MEYFISKSNFSDFFPNLLNGIHLGCIRRNENNTDIFRDDQRVRLARLYKIKAKLEKMKLSDKQVFELKSRLFAIEEYLDQIKTV